MRSLIQCCKLFLETGSFCNSGAVAQLQLPGPKISLKSDEYAPEGMTNAKSETMPARNKADKIGFFIILFPPLILSFIFPHNPLLCLLSLHLPNERLLFSPGSAPPSEVRVLHRLGPFWFTVDRYLCIILWFLGSLIVVSVLLFFRLGEKCALKTQPPNQEKGDQTR